MGGVEGGILSIGDFAARASRLLGEGWWAWVDCLGLVIMAGVIGGWLLWRLVSKALERAYDEGWL
jgi:hypothetical protein